MISIRKLPFVIVIVALSLLGISAIQQKIIKSKIEEAIFQINSDNKVNYHISINSIDLKIPFVIKLNSINVSKKKSNEKVFSSYNSYALVNPFPLVLNKISIIYLFVDKVHLNTDLKKEHDDKEDIYLPNISVSRCFIKNIEGLKISNFPIKIQKADARISLNSNGNNVFCNAKIKDLIENTSIVADICISKTREFTLDIFSKNIPESYYYSVIDKLKNYNFNLFTVNNIYSILKGKDIFNPFDELEISFKSSGSISLDQIEEQNGNIAANILVKKNIIEIKSISIHNYYSSHAIDGIYDYFNNEYFLNLSSSIFEEIKYSKFNTRFGKSNNISGTIHGIGEDGNFHVNVSTDYLNINLYKLHELHDSSLDLQGTFNKNGIHGSFAINGKYSENTNIKFSSKFRYAYKNNKSFLKNILLYIGGTCISGNIEALLSNHGIVPIGSLDISSGNISDLSSIFKKELRGSLEGKILLNGRDAYNIDITTKSKLHNFQMQDLSLEEAEVSANINWGRNISGSFLGSAKYIISKQAQIREISIQIEKYENTSRGVIDTSGFFGQPFSLYLSYEGSWNEKDIIVNILKINNIFGAHVLTSDSPFSVQIKNMSEIFIPRASLSVGNDRSGKIEVRQMENQSISLFGKDIGMSTSSDRTGKRFDSKLNFNAVLSNNLESPSIMLQSEIDLWDESSSYGYSTIKSSLSIDALFTNADILMYSNGNQIGYLKINSFTSHIIPGLDYGNTYNSNASFKFTGNIGSAISSIFGIDISGHLDADTNIIFNPYKNFIDSSGYINFIEGQLSIPASGIYAKDINAALTIEKSIIEVSSISAKDSKEGLLLCKGRIALPNKTGSYYSMNLDVDNFKVIDLPHLSLSLNGHAIYEGNFIEGIIVGNLNISNLEASMDHPTAYIKPKTIHIDNIYDKEISNTKEIFITTINKLPKLYLDVTITTDKPARFYSSKLETYWSGSLRVYGNIKYPLLDGTMNLTSGSMPFGNRSFGFIHGKTIWSKSPFDQFSLNALGDLEIGGYHVFTNISIANKKWSIQTYSTPYLTTREITSLIIFGKNISSVKDRANIGHLVYALWSFSTSMYKGYFYEFLQRNISIKTFDYENITYDKGYSNVSMKIGARYSDVLFAGMSYYSLSEKYHPILFADLSLWKNLNLSFIGGYNIAGAGLVFELEF